MPDVTDTTVPVAGRYRLIRQIGSGGMGRVWLARDEVLHREVAIKEVVLPTGLSEAERQGLVDATLREARAAGRLSHPNVVQVYDVVTFEARPWIVMEYVPSRSLYQVIRSEGPLPPRRVAEIGLHVLAALRAAHKARVWHRDVKPGNVLLATDGRVVLTDFGLATFDGDGGITRSGLILGSAQYISPERARDGISGPEADMWSLGATLYTAVEGRSPYARDSAMATLTALATQPPDAPHRAGPLRHVLIGLLRRNPRHRLGGAETEKMLRAVASGEVKQGHGRWPRSAPDPGEPVLTGAATTPDEPGRRRWPWLVLAAAVVVGLVGAGMAYALSRPGAPGVAAPTPTAPTTPPLTAAMGVQACEASPPTSGVPVTGTPTLPGVLLAAPDGWVYYTDQGFRVAVPAVWRVWRLGPLLCFRDPSSVRAAAVMSESARTGPTAQLLTGDEAARTAAAHLVDYHQVGLYARTFADGEATELEYTCTANSTQLHGADLLVRAHGPLYLLSWVGADYTWTSEQQLKNAFQASFGLDA
jgi:hypothetical protein